MVLYRPFDVRPCYFDDFFIHRLSNMPSIFPDAHAKNILIATNGTGARSVSVMASKYPVDFHFLESGARCFPRDCFADIDEDLFAVDDKTQHSQEKRRNGIVSQLTNITKLKAVTFDDAMSYAYAICHHDKYRNKYNNNLLRNAPRIPIIENSAQVSELIVAGRQLIELHADFESAEQYPVTLISPSILISDPISEAKKYRVHKMKFAGTRGSEDKSTVIYNEHIAIKNIPLEANEYVVNGKPALEWVMERQCVKVDKDSGIVNDANDYANETMNNPAYPLELFQRVITVSLETMKIVRSLPKLDL